MRQRDLVRRMFHTKPSPFPPIPAVELLSELCRAQLEEKMIEEGISSDLSEFLRESNQKFVKDSAVEATHLVLPSHANTTNITFGGQV